MLQVIFYIKRLFSSYFYYPTEIQFPSISQSLSGTFPCFSGQITSTTNKTQIAELFLDPRHFTHHGVLNDVLEEEWSRTSTKPRTEWNGSWNEMELECQMAGNSVAVVLLPTFVRRKLELADFELKKVMLWLLLLMVVVNGRQQSHSSNHPF